MGPFGCNEEKGTAVKRCAKLMIAFGTAATLMGCGAALADEAAAAAPGSPQEIVAAIQDDFAATTENLTAGLAQVDETIGGTFEGYLANEQVLADWYGTVVDETEALFERTNENAMAYYRAVAGTVDHGDSDALEDAMDELYDAVYEDACEDYHDDVYEDLLEEAYDAYYDGIIDDAEDSVAFDVWLDARSGAYSDWLDVRSDVYSAYLDVRSDLYGDIIDVKSAFWQGVFDIDAVVVVLPEVQLDSAKLEPVAHDGTPEGILAAIEGDFASTAEGLAASLENARVAVGDTFDGYVANEQTVLAWYASTIGETEPSTRGRAPVWRSTTRRSWRLWTTGTSPRSRTPSMRRTTASTTMLLATITTQSTRTCSTTPTTTGTTASSTTRATSSTTPRGRL